MKYRLDFVTNSSSSSFILAMKENNLEEQKEKIFKYVVENLIGEKVLKATDDEETISKFIEDNYISAQREKEIRKELLKGKDIYFGRVTFEESDYQLSDIYKELWDRLNQNEGFSIIDGNLQY